MYKDKEGKPMLDKEGKQLPSIYIFDGEFNFNRVDFGIGKSGASLGDEVKVTFSIEAHKEEEKKIA